MQYSELDLTSALELARLEAIQALVVAMNYRDQATGGHNQRVSELAYLLGKKLHLNRIELEQLKLAGLLHDLGKMGVSDLVLRKNAGLNHTETKEMRKHTLIGTKILSQLQGFEDVSLAILNHHERWDGQGYPQGLKSYEIPLFSRILAIADSYDAMMNDRPYRKALSHKTAMAEILANRGSQFDPELVDLFLTLEHCVGSEGLLKFDSIHGMV